VVPRPADAGSTLEHVAVLGARPAQADRERDPGEAAPDDRDKRAVRCYISVSYSRVTSGGVAARMTGSERREQLLDVTKAIAVADGFHAVSIEAVARAAGITRPIVYGHFSDLGGLLEALVERESRRALEQLPETYDDLLAALTAYLEAVRTDPDTWRLVLMPQEGAPRLLHERIAAGRAAVIARLAQALRPDSNLPDPELSAHMLSAYADEAARLVLQDYDVARILELTRWALARLGA
jgi:AcrR family transcriptional regulator